MKIGVIDIGSNSVRLMLWADGKTFYKRMQTTRLGDGLNSSSCLNEDACKRTVEAISAFASEARADGAEAVYAFATAAVRCASNPRHFLDMVEKACNIKVRVLDGEEEAHADLNGALGHSDGGIIDVGGASTEVMLREGGKLTYWESVNIGTVRILDAAGRDMDKIEEFIGRKIAEFGEGDFSGAKFCAVGGTATRLAAIKHSVKEYEPEILNGTRLTVGEINEFAKRLTTLPVEFIRANTICTKSADLIGGGAKLMAMVMENFGIEEVCVSVNDNLEGYAQMLCDKEKL